MVMVPTSSEKALILDDDVSIVLEMHLQDTEKNAKTKVIAVDEVSSVDQNTTTVRDTTEKNENNKMKMIVVNEDEDTTVRDTPEKKNDNKKMADNAKMKMIATENEDTTVSCENKMKEKSAYSLGSSNAATIKGAEKEKKSAATEVPYLDLATFDWRSDKKLMKKMMQKKKPKMRTMTINLVPWTPRGYSSVRPRRKNMFRWLDLAASDVQISNAYMRLDNGSMWEYQKENWEKFSAEAMLKDDHALVVPQVPEEREIQNMASCFPLCSCLPCSVL